MAYSKANYGASGIRGAGEGAAAAAKASGGNGYATAAGGIIGFVAGLFEAAAAEEDYKRRMEILDKAAQQLDTDYNTIEQLYGEFAKNYTPGGWTVDENGNKVSQAEIAMTKAAESINKWDSTVTDKFKDAGILDENGNLDKESMKFSYKNEDGSDKTVDDFINPYMDSVIDASNAKVQHSAAGAGLGRSTGAAKAIAENTAKEYDQLYRTALGAYQQDRSQSYNEWSGYLDNVNKNLQNILSQQQWQIGQQKDLGDEFLDWQSSLVDSQAAIEGEKANAKTQIELTRATI